MIKNRIAKAIGASSPKPYTAIPDHILLKCESHRLVKLPWGWFKVVDVKKTDGDGGSFINLENGPILDLL